MRSMASVSTSKRMARRQRLERRPRRARRRQLLPRHNEGQAAMPTVSLSISVLPSFALPVLTGLAPGPCPLPVVAQQQAPRSSSRGPGVPFHDPVRPSGRNFAAVRRMAQYSFSIKFGGGVLQQAATPRHRFNFASPHRSPGPERKAIQAFALAGERGVLLDVEGLRAESAPHQVTSAAAQGADETEKVKSISISKGHCRPVHSTGAASC